MTETARDKRSKEDLDHEVRQAFEKHKAGQLAEAERSYLAVLERDRDNIHALNLLGMLCVNDFRPDEAVFFIAYIDL